MSGTRWQKMDYLVTVMTRQWEDVEKAEEEVKRLRARYDETEAEVMEALKRSKKTSYKVDGVGTAYISQKFVVKCPKDLTSKKTLFAWIRKSYDETTLYTLLSINHQSLNSWYNAEAEAHKEKKKPFEVLGLEAPTSYESLGFRADRKKKGKE
jgi:hypothetical protein